MHCSDLDAGTPIVAHRRLGWLAVTRRTAGTHMPSSEAATRTTSRRERHKSRTRQALREAALELFAAQGFDTTTTEEIAEKAGVSVRTFFRYFPTKELVLFFGRYDFVQAFVAELVRQPQSKSDLDAIRAAYSESAPGFADR